MTLGERRGLFTRLLATLLGRMCDAGFQPRIGEVQRPGIAALFYGLDESQCDRIAVLLRSEFPYVATEVSKIRSVLGSKHSVHIEALAADIVLCRADGTPLIRTEDHEPFGSWWEQQHGLARWGGRFNDGGHYSVTPDGVRK